MMVSLCFASADLPQSLAAQNRQAARSHQQNSKLYLEYRVISEPMLGLRKYYDAHVSDNNWIILLMQPKMSELS
jgi:hypothetical protein